MQLLVILVVLTEHHTSVRVMTVAPTFGLVRQGHVLVVPFGQGCIRIISGGLHVLVLGIQNIDVHHNFIKGV